MTSCARLADHLDVYHDAELSRLVRRRVERHLERCAGCRRKLARADTLRELLRESEAAATSPDLWSGIEPRLGALDAKLAADRIPAPARRGALERLRAMAVLSSWLVRPAAAMAAIALLVTATVVGLGSGEAPAGGAVRWLDSHGSSVLLLEDQDATIIWLIDPVLDELSTTRGVLRAVI